LVIAVYKTVIEESKGDVDVAVIQTGTAFDVLMMMATVMMATVIMAGSPPFKNAHDLRVLCAEACKKMRKEIAAARADPRMRKFVRRDLRTRQGQRAPACCNAQYD
jgi:hypothetical protein